MMAILEEIFIVAMLLVVGIIVVSGIIERRSRVVAVEAGAPEYYLDQDNNKQFRFKECKE